MKFCSYLWYYEYLIFLFIKLNNYTVLRGKLFLVPTILRCIGIDILSPLMSTSQLNVCFHASISSYAY